MKACIIKPNTLELTDDNGCQYLQFHRTIVVKYRAGDGFTLDPRWDCSKTTTGRVSGYIGIAPKEIRERIKTGQYKVVDLNGPGHEI